MSKKSKKTKIIIFFLIVLIPLLLVFGVGYYKINYWQPVIEEQPIPEVEEKISEENNKLSGKNKKPPKTEISEEESEIPETIEDENSEQDIEPEIEAISIEEIEKIPSVQKELSPVYISHSKSLFRKNDSQDNSFINNARLTQDQREVLKIDNINKGIKLSDIPSEYLLKGKTYYEGDNGRLESVIHIGPEGKMHEYLISYDPEGNYVENIEIGLIIPGSDERKYATIAINKLSVFELQSSKELGKREEKVTEYYINPHLQFNKGKTFSRLK